MSVKDGAHAFAKWARKQGIVPDFELIEHDGADVDIPFDDDEHEARCATILQRSGVHMIGFSEETNAVHIYYGKRIVKRNLAVLPQSLGLDTDIVWHPSKGVASIDHAVAAVATGLSPVTTIGDRFTCGSSIGVGVFGGAGTLGCLVQDEDGEIFGLSNNHVTGGCNHSPVDLPVVAPGPLDMIANTMDPFCLGHHARSIPIALGIPGAVDHRNNMDAALLRIADVDFVSSMQREHYDTPSHTLDPVPNMVVTKVGRTTGLTTGRVIAQAGIRVPVSYNIVEAPFVGTAYFEPVFVVQSSAGEFAMAGDSGSLVVGVDPNGEPVAVGIVFAVNGDLTYIQPINRVLEDLGVELVSGHNVS